MSDKKEEKEKVTVPVPKVSKSGKKVPDHWMRKDWAEKDIVKLKAEVESMPVGTLCEVVGNQFDGAVFIVTPTVGDRAGETFRIKTDELELVRKYVPPEEEGK